MTLYAIGDERPRIHPDAYIHPEAVLIGDVRIGPGSSVWPGAVIRADNGPDHRRRPDFEFRTAPSSTPKLYRDPDRDDCVIGHLVRLEGSSLRERSPDRFGLSR